MLQLKRYVTVHWTKEFIDGPMEGIWYIAELSFDTRESADDYLEFLNKHRRIPVDPCVGSSSYIVHDARIVE